MTKKKLPDQEENSVRIKRLNDDFLEFVSEFKEESDRAAVILGASKLDQLLGMVLEKFLLPSPTSSDSLFNNNGPLGTFSSKIDICYRLGLIDAEFCRNIHLVRRIRNSFAHEIYGAKLDSGSHKDRVKSLITRLRGEEIFKICHREYFDNENSVRAEFSTALGLMIARLEGFHDRLKPIQAEPLAITPSKSIEESET